MRHLTLFLLLLTTLFSCRDPLVQDPLSRSMRMQDRFARYARSGIGVSDSSAVSPPGPEEPKGPDFYATALYFPDSANWRLDSLWAARVLLFKNGELTGSYPVPSPPDPERHRVRGGHLWTDMTDGRTTRILCDGVEKYSFSGEELIRGFLQLGGALYTLGQRPGRGGFCYRVNGKPVFESPVGTLLGNASLPEWEGGALGLDGGDICYSYSIPVQRKDRLEWEYHVMRGSESLQTLPAGTAEALYDIRVWDGKVYRIQKKDGQICLADGVNSYAMSASLSDSFSGHLIPYKGSLTLKGSSRAGGEAFNCWIYDPSIWNARSFGRVPSERSALLVDGDDWLLASVNPSGVVEDLLLGREKLPLPGGPYQLMTPLCLSLSGGHYAAALTHASGSRHLLIADGKTYELPFNGYFTSVRIE